MAIQSKSKWPKCLWEGQNTEFIANWKQYKLVAIICKCKNIFLRIGKKVYGNVRAILLKLVEVK